MTKNIILWIDDDFDLLKLQKEFLEEERYKVVQFADVDAGLSFLHDNKTSIIGIIVDVMMSPGRILRSRVIDGGLTTGLALIEYCYETNALRSAEAPSAMIFSYRYDPASAEKMAEMGVSYYQKQDHMGMAVCDLVRGEFGDPEVSANA